ncbi:MAG: nicotinamide-nucleotide amidohydrolase family protein [Gammaproteobacteria bacterium]|nr:nicotinamide-nucleotide amidohydrolase family protein [Gammaproteobacteria bacterium]
MSVSDSELMNEAQAVGRDLLEVGWMLATAESCTGGWLSKVITDLPGSSHWFEGGLVTYSDLSKVELLGVTPLSLEKYGAVSEAVVREMVLGLLAQTGAHLGVSISGIAGPDGGTDEKPVGTVWFAWGRQGGEIEAACECFRGDREAVRRQAVLFALQGLRGFIG